MKILFCICFYSVYLTLSSSIPIDDSIWINQNTLTQEDILSFDYDNFLLKNDVPKIEGRVTGGVEVIPNSIPYQVALSLRKNYGITTLCGGSLISKNFILTAAHCLQQTKFGFALLGAHNIRKESYRIKIEIENFIIHPDFNTTTLNNDIALIKLPESIELNEKIQLIKLPSNDNTISTKIDKTGTKAIASGWGMYSDDIKFTSNVLRFVDLIVLDQIECTKFYNDDVIKNGNLCTNGDSGKSTCSGDSGGPLVITNNYNENIQIGISSFGSKNGCEKGFPAVFTRITSFLDWINENIKS